MTHINLYQKLKLTYKDTGETLSWFLILRISDNRFIGINNEGHWVVEAKDHLYPIGDCFPYFYVVLLEQDIHEVRNKITLYLENRRIALNIDDIFPFVEIIRAGLGADQSYWKELALRWYSEISLDSKKLLVDSLSKLVKDRGVGQSVLHKAVKGLRQAEVEHEFIDKLINERKSTNDTVSFEGRPHS